MKKLCENCKHWRSFESERGIKGREELSKCYRKVNKPDRETRYVVKNGGRQRDPFFATIERNWFIPILFCGPWGQYYEEKQID